jgi:hypothetical protein
LQEHTQCSCNSEGTNVSWQSCLQRRNSVLFFLPVMRQ